MTTCTHRHDDERTRGSVGRRSFMNLGAAGVAGAAALAALPAAGATAAAAKPLAGAYADPADPALPPSTMALRKGSTALLGWTPRSIS